MERENEKYIKDEKRREMEDYGMKIENEKDYIGDGKVELIMDEDKGKLYLIEVNKRIKVENKVKEEVKGIDIVKEKINIMEGFEIGKKE